LRQPREDHVNFVQQRIQILRPLRDGRRRRQGRLLGRLAAQRLDPLAIRRVRRARVRSAIELGRTLLMIVQPGQLPEHVENRGVLALLRPPLRQRLVGACIWSHRHRLIRHHQDAIAAFFHRRRFASFEATSRQTSTSFRTMVSGAAMEAIATGFVESTVSQMISKRMVKKQQMR
jgi:hypothetical protein